MKRKNYLLRARKRIFYSLSEVERITGLHRKRIYTLERMGFVKSRLQSGRRFYTERDLKRLMDFRYLSKTYPMDVIVRNYEELKLEAELKRYRERLMGMRNRIVRLLKEMGEYAG